MEPNLRRSGGREHLSRPLDRHVAAALAFLRLASLTLRQQRPKGRFFCAEFRNAPMQYHRHFLLAAVAAIVWTVPAHASGPEPDAELAVDIQPVATWVVVEARNHA